MTQLKQKIILVYGQSQIQEIRQKTQVPVVDVLDPRWLSELKVLIKPAQIEECIFLCIGTAFTIARKKLPKDLTILIQDISNLTPEILDREEEQQRQPAAAVIDKIVVAQKVHPATQKAKAWLNTHHLELINKLLAKGYEIEILDEANNKILQPKEK